MSFRLSGMKCPIQILPVTFSTVSLIFVPRRFPHRLRTNTASGVWEKEVSMGGSSFEANNSLTFKEAARSIQD